MEAAARWCVGVVPHYRIYPAANVFFLDEGQRVVGMEPDEVQSLYSHAVFQNFPHLEYFARCVSILNYAPQGNPYGQVDRSFEQLVRVGRWDARFIWHRNFYTDPYPHFGEDD